MSAADVLKAASTAARDLAGDSSGPSYRKLVRNFVDALARVPDYPAADFSPLEIEQLSSTAEHVIVAIERRLEDGGDQSGVKQELAEMIDDVRRSLEKITRWRRHYLESSTS